MEDKLSFGIDSRLLNSQNKETHHLYLQELKKEIENKKTKIDLAKKEKIEEEKQLNHRVFNEINLIKKRNIEEKAKLKDYIAFLNKQIKEKDENKQSEREERKHNYEILDIGNSINNDKRSDYRRRKLYNSVSFNSDENKIQPNESNVNNISLFNDNKYIYFKNRELSHSGQYKYTNKESMISEIVSKYQSNLKAKKIIEPEVSNNCLIQNSSSLQFDNVKIPITYENASNDYQIMLKYKKKQDQLLIKHMLDEQLKSKKIQNLQIRSNSCSFNNSIFINPIKDYTHNKYINKLRLKEGIPT